MTAPGVPSPQEELRDAISSALSYTAAGADCFALTDAILPLFAARVAAIEAERNKAYAVEREQSKRAERAEAELAALTDRVAAAVNCATNWGHDEDCPVIVDPATPLQCWCTRGEILDALAGKGRGHQYD